MVDRLRPRPVREDCVLEVGEVGRFRMKETEDGIYDGEATMHIRV